MNTTKTIINSIYFGGLTIAIILDLTNFQFYYGVVFVAVQIIFIATEYTITNRNFPNELLLIKKHESFRVKDLLLVIPFTIVWMVGINLCFKVFNTKYLVAYISIAVLSVIIQFLIIKDKSTATLLIDKNKLIVNDLFIKAYNLDTLKSISFDGLYETYTAEFANSKKIIIKQDQFVTDDLNKFIAVMAKKSLYNVALSENIRNEITCSSK